ncbi:MAG: type II secretion system minor pseudopilin GspK [Duganella sp.]
MRRLARLPWRARHQRGVAVVTALLLTTLAVTIVASLFWQQQVQVRSMENQRLQLQTRWIVRGALDLSRLVLFQDFLDSNNVTKANGLWAMPLEETRLDDYVERERREGEDYNATLSGRMIDAQSRYNLANLANARTINQDELAVFERLLRHLQLNPSLALTVARQVAYAQPVVAKAASTGASGTNTGSGGTTTNTGSSGTSTNNIGSSSGGSGTGIGGGGAQPLPPGGGEPMELLRVEDLLAVSGFTPQAVEKLRDFVIVLPQPTPVNVNTAPAEVLAALSPNMPLSDAAVLVNMRKQGDYAQDVARYAIKPQLTNRKPVVDIAVKSSYFLAYSRVQLDRASLDAVSLLQRGNGGLTTIVWIREN